jgi:hypothetical protein
LFYGCFLLGWSDGGRSFCLKGGVGGGGGCFKELKGQKGVRCVV